YRRPRAPALESSGRIAARHALCGDSVASNLPACAAGTHGGAYDPPSNKKRKSGREMARIERQFAGRPLVIEAGKMARQADGSCVVRFGETMVLCTAVAQDNPTHLPFFPLTVEYREKTYAAGKIPGGYIK